MRKLVLIGLTVATAIVVASVALAQSTYPLPIVALSGQVIPAKGGTKKKPKNAATKLHFDVNKESYSTLGRIDYTIPSSVKLNGTGFKTCSVETINNTGEDSCPKASQVGTGGATALVGPKQTPLIFTVRVYAAGKSALTLSLHTSLFNIAIPATIGGGKVGFDIPANVQRPIAGLYSYVTSVDAYLGHQPGISGKAVTGKGKKKKTHYFVSRVGCTNKKDNFAVSLGLVTNDSGAPRQNPAGATSTSACKK